MNVPIHLMVHNILLHENEFGSPPGFFLKANHACHISRAARAIHNLTIKKIKKMAVTFDVPAFASFWNVAILLIIINGGKLCLNSGQFKGNYDNSFSLWYLTRYDILILLLINMPFPDVGVYSHSRSLLKLSKSERDRTSFTAQFTDSYFLYTVLTCTWVIHFIYLFFIDIYIAITILLYVCMLYMIHQWGAMLLIVIKTKFIEDCSLSAATIFCHWRDGPVLRK